MKKFLQALGCLIFPGVYYLTASVLDGHFNPKYWDANYKMGMMLIVCVALLVAAVVVFANFMSDAIFGRPMSDEKTTGGRHE